MSARLSKLWLEFEEWRRGRFAGSCADKCVDTCYAPIGLCGVFMSDNVNITGLLDLARELTIRGRYREAIEMLDSGLREARGSEAQLQPPRLVRLMIALIQALESMLRQEPTQEDEARSRRLQQDLAGLLEGETALQPLDRARGWGSLGNVAYMRSRFQEAADCFARCLELDARDVAASTRGGVARAWAWHGYSGALLSLGRAEEALAASERGMPTVVSLDPRSAQVLSVSFTIHKATALLLMRRFAEAAEIFEGLEASRPGPGFLKEIRERLAFARAGSICRFDERGVLVAVAGDAASS